MADVETEFRQMHPSHNLQLVNFFDLEYADDTVLFASSRTAVQLLLHLVERESALYNLSLNRAKCELMVQNPTQNAEITIHFSTGEQVTQVQTVKDLGQRLSADLADPVNTNDIRRKLGEAFESLKTFWAHAGLP